jgi:hypothetical protein
MFNIATWLQNKYGRIAPWIIAFYSYEYGAQIHLGVNFVREYKNHVSPDYIGGKDKA